MSRVKHSKRLTTIIRVLTPGVRFIKIEPVLTVRIAKLVIRLLQRTLGYYPGIVVLSARFLLKTMVERKWASRKACYQYIALTRSSSAIIAKRDV